MKALLVDVDSKIPNLALMKLSAWHKQRGDLVGFNVPNPDRVYISVIYRKNLWRVRAIEKMFPNAEVYAGGTFSPVWLASDVEFLKPDYDLYPSTYSMGFTTRGCFRKCPWCVVPQKEGPLRQWQHPRAFTDPRFSTVMLLDNNWLGLRDWFFKTSEWLISHRLRVWEGGLDIRLVTEETAHQLKRLTMAKPYHFAFDSLDLEPVIEDRLALLRNVGFDLRHNVEFYVYLDKDQDFASALYRAERLKQWGTNAFIMFNVDAHRTARVRALQHWANRKQLFWSCSFQDWECKK